MNFSALSSWQRCFDSLQEAVWLVDARSHRILFANAAAARMALQPAEDFLGRHVLEVAGTPQDLAFWNETPETIAQGMDSVSGLLRSDGVLLSVERRIAAFSFPGADDVLLMSMVDRSAQQAGQRQLQAVLAQLRATLDSAADGMLVCGRDGSVLFFNEQFTHLWKMPRSLLVQRDDDAIHAFMAACLSDPSTHVQRLRALALTPDTPSHDLIALRDGRTLERRSVPQVFQGGVTGRVFSFRDITVELERQAELRLAAQVFECSTGAIFIADSEHQVLQLNPAAEALLGQSLRQLRGHKVVELLDTGFALPDFLAQVNAAWTQSGAWQGQAKAVLANGSCPVHLSWVAVRDASGRVNKSVGFLRDLREQQAAQKQLCELAYTDALTGLPNRLLLAQHMAGVLQAKNGDTAQFAVLCLDLDRFRLINDSLGYGFGDRVLQLVAARLRSSLRPEDMLCRPGGNGFVVCLNACSRDTAETLARRIIDDMRRPFVLDGVGFSIQCSMGAATYPQDGRTLDDLMAQANTAMRHAKGQGGGCHAFYQPEMGANLLGRKQMEHALRQALEQGHMSVCYQPQVQLASDRIVAAEALLRWTDPVLGAVPAAAFIALAQETGYIVTLGAWVLEQAVQQAACWMQDGMAMVVSVNVSALEFRQPDFVPKLVRLLQLHGLPGGLLELELTESTLLQDAPEAARQLAALAALDVALVLDDFGAGHSSLAYLKDLPIHKLKVDPSFVRGLAGGNGDRAMVSTIVHMAHALRMGVVAEGVETLEQHTLLQALGCDYFQGCLCAPALAPAAFNALLLNKNGAPAHGALETFTPQ